MTTAWTAQRNKADLIKCSSTTDGKTRYSPFNSQIKKCMEAFRHDFLLLFLQSYFNDKCPERIIACKNASNARGEISQLAGDSFTLTENGHALYQSDITSERSKIIFSPEFNVAIILSMHHAYANECKSEYTQHNSINLPICLARVPHCPVKSHLLSWNRSIARWSP